MWEKNDANLRHEKNVVIVKEIETNLRHTLSWFAALIALRNISYSSILPFEISFDFDSKFFLYVLILLFNFSQAFNAALQQISDVADAAVPKVFGCELELFSPIVIRFIGTPKLKATHWTTLVSIPCPYIRRNDIWK